MVTGVELICSFQFYDKAEVQLETQLESEGKASLKIKNKTLSGEAGVAALGVFFFQLMEFTTFFFVKIPEQMAQSQPLLIA